MSSANNYFNFKFSLQDIVQIPIDLLEEKSLKIHISESLLTYKHNLFMYNDIKAWLYNILNAMIVFLKSGYRPADLVVFGPLNPKPLKYLWEWCKMQLLHV